MLEEQPLRGGNVNHRELIRGGNAKGKKRTVTMEEVPDEDESMEEAGGDFAPGGDADYFTEEDEEGRFFGGGLTTEQKKILNIFDRAPTDMLDEVGEHNHFR